VGSPKFQVDLDSGYNDDVWKKPLNRPIIPNEVTKQNKRQKINVLENFQPWLKITHQCYNNL
jgi:hypothetical protein